MSEHRPHWDDSLVEAVRREIYGFLPVVVGDQIEVTCAVIAAVEDWHKMKRDSRVRTHAADGSCWRWHEECAEALIESLTAERDALRAQVQRVRELHHFVVDEIETREGPEDVQHCSECGYIPTDEEPCPTLAALNTGT